MEGEVLDSFRYLDHRQRTFVFEVGTPPQLIYTSVVRGLPDAPRMSLPGGPIEARQHSPLLVCSALLLRRRRVQSLLRSRLRNHIQENLEIVWAAPADDEKKMSRLSSG